MRCQTLKRIMQSRHTIELRYIQDDPDFDLFSFDYDFYEPILKKEFENKFMDFYRYKEIGFETIERFQRQLMSKLNMIMPYYRQLYITELRSKNIDFMLNKDLKETFERALSSNDETLMNSIMETLAKNTNESTSNTIHKESVLNNINANIGDGKLTGMSSDEGTDSGSSTQTGNDKSNSTSNSKSKLTESTTLISQGNIGVTSSAELLEKWRSVLINIDRMIIEDECWDLFSLL